MSSPFPWLHVAGLAGSLVLAAAADVSAQLTHDAGTAAQAAEGDEEAEDDEEDDVMYVDDGEETADGEKIGPGSASISGGGLGCALAHAHASDAVAPLLLFGLLIARRRR